MKDSFIENEKSIQELISLAMKSHREFVTIVGGRIIRIKSRRWPYILPVLLFIPFIFIVYLYPSFYHIFGLVGFICWYSRAIANPGVKVKIV